MVELLGSMMVVCDILVWGDLPHVLILYPIGIKFSLGHSCLILKVPRLKANLTLCLVIDYTHSGHILVVIHM